MHVLKLALAYFAMVFAAGFILGALRVLVLVPQVGSRTAELLEMPLMLIAIGLGARWVKQHSNTTHAQTLLSIGLLALVFLLLAEVGVGVGLRGLSPLESLVNPDPISGTIYYILLGVFAIMPWLLSRHQAPS